MTNNDSILERRVRLRLQDESPQVGDYVIFPDGHEERIAHDWDGLGVQTAPSGSFYLDDGYAGFSGALNPTIPTARLTDTGEAKQGAFWFFSNDEWRAHNSLDVQAPCPVWRYPEDAS